MSLCDCMLKFASSRCFQLSLDHNEQQTSSCLHVMCGQLSGYECVISFICLCFVWVGVHVCLCICFTVLLLLFYCDSFCVWVCRFISVWWCEEIVRESSVDQEQWLSPSGRLRVFSSDYSPCYAKKLLELRNIIISFIIIISVL